MTTLEEFYLKVYGKNTVVLQAELNALMQNKNVSMSQNQLNMYRAYQGVGTAPLSPKPVSSRPMPFPPPSPPVLSRPIPTIKPGIYRKDTHGNYIPIPVDELLAVMELAECLYENPDDIAKSLGWYIFEDSKEALPLPVGSGTLMIKG